VSHLKERKEKHCLNCNAMIHGKYCSICGQENVEPQESLWHLITHTFNDITHFDGKFFSSIKYIITKPGFLSSEYARGKRKSYLDPIRFYLFTSAFFFFILFSFFIDKSNLPKKTTALNNISKRDSIKIIENLEDAGIDSVEINNLIRIVRIDSLKKMSDSIEVISDLTETGIDTIALAKTLKTYGIDSLKRLDNKLEEQGLKQDYNFNIFGEAKYTTLEKYDSLDKIGKINDTKIEKYYVRRQLNFRKQYNYNSKLVNKAMKDVILHLIPQVLFLSLPFFAFLLQILYSRNKRFYYVSHVIFTLHLYIFVYIDIFFINLISTFLDYKYLGWLEAVIVFMGFYILYYLYRAMRNFYEQRRGKTVLKYFILLFSLLFLLFILAIILMGLLIFKI
jgi:hypothetical protein